MSRQITEKDNVTDLKGKLLSRKHATRVTATKLNEQNLLRIYFRLSGKKNRFLFLHILRDRGLKNVPLEYYVKTQTILKVRDHYVSQMVQIAR